MIYGLYLDPRAWTIDITSSSLWNPDKYGVHIDLHPDAFNIPKLGIDKKYKFVIATEVWEIPMRKALDYLRKMGLKVFLLAREPIKFGNATEGMFSFEKFKYNGEYCFVPDAVFAVSEKYAKLWESRTKTYVTGYPRWDWCIDKTNWKNRDQFNKQYGIRPDTKIIFFPSFPPYAYLKVNGKDKLIDIFDSRENILETCIEFAKNHQEYQFISKIHPMSMKCYLKKTGPGRDVCGLLEKYYKQPTSYAKVIGDQRMSSEAIRDLTIHSHLVVGLWSTVMLDAVILGKPAIQVITGKNIHMLQNPWAGMFPIVNTSTEFYEILVKYNLEGCAISDMAKQKTSEHICLDGAVCDRVCSAVRELICK